MSLKGSSCSPAPQQIQKNRDIVFLLPGTVMLHEDFPAADSRSQRVGILRHCPRLCLQGLYEDCAEKIAELFDKNAPCYLPHCTFNGRYQPTLGSLDGFGERYRDLM